MSLTVKLALFTSMLCIALISGVIYFSYQISSQEMTESLGKQLEAIVRTASLGIDGDLHDQIQSVDDVESEAFQSLRDHLRMVKSVNNLETEMYTMRRTSNDSGNAVMEFVVMTNEKPYVGELYELKPEMNPTLIQGKSTYTDVYMSPNGTWISAFAPILDSKGQVSGLVEADYQVDTLLALLRAKFMDLVWKGVGFSIVAVLLSFFLAKRITSRIKYLTETTEKISLGKIETPIQMSGRDEVSRLGSALERMRESLVIANKLLE